ncbi:MAG TPA: acyl-CoA reductase [Chitinophagaceae bacterium]|nr:acyl-CoA reductase [Chitinophagaceae bacterium]
MNLQHRIDLLTRLGDYMLSPDPAWQEVKEKASVENGWFIPEFIEIATKNIATTFLQKDKLQAWTANYQLQTTNHKAVTVGIVMAGNIPLVGFHDWLCVFLSGHRSMIKPSSSDQVLIRHLVEKMVEFETASHELFMFSEMLKGCDAYIATGSNNSSRYFEYYFDKYPHIIRRNRTSVAILDGKETQDDLKNLSDDVYLFFGRGCRNVTKLYTPTDYDFVPLLEAFKKYNRLADHHKYKNNLDYNLAIYILNKKFYMSTGSLLVVEEPSFFAPVGQLNYEFYTDKNSLVRSLAGHPDLQCIIGREQAPFGSSQSPAIGEFADGVDTMAFLTNL